MAWWFHMGINEMSHHKFRKWLVPDYHPNQYSVSIEPLDTSFSEICIQIHIPRFFFQKNAFENVLSKMLAIFSRHQCVNKCKVLHSFWHELKICMFLPKVFQLYWTQWIHPNNKLISPWCCIYASGYWVSIGSDTNQRIQTKLWTLKGHPISHPNRWAMGCLLQIFGIALCYNTSILLYLYNRMPE